MKLFKKILVGLLVVLIIIQFIQPAKNKEANITEQHVYNVYNTPNEVKLILDKACNDCHSNNTTYPWYASIQPLSLIHI